jgi:orotate phosphoribosyltransferase-like protein
VEEKQASLEANASKETVLWLQERTSESEAREGLQVSGELP